MNSQDEYYMNLQEKILTECIEKRVPATVYLNNGFQMRGIIIACDTFVIVLITEEKQQMLYKHSVSTIAPMRPLECLENR